MIYDLRSRTYDGSSLRCEDGQSRNRTGVYPAVRKDLKHYDSVALNLENLQEKIDFAHLFGRSAPVHIEIGSGKGTFLVNQAAAQALQSDGQFVVWLARTAGRSGDLLRLSVRRLEGANEELAEFTMRLPVHLQPAFYRQLG